jgi:hypothetical protein
MGSLSEQICVTLMSHMGSLSERHAVRYVQYATAEPYSGTPQCNHASLYGGLYQMHKRTHRWYLPTKNASVDASDTPRAKCTSGEHLRRATIFNHVQLPDCHLYPHPCGDRFYLYLRITLRTKFTCATWSGRLCLSRKRQRDDTQTGSVATERTRHAADEKKKLITWLSMTIYINN